MTLKIGLTGSIATGKTTTANLIKELGIPVFDADAQVHELYSRDGAAVAAINALCPAAVVNRGVDRDRLAQAIQRDGTLLKKIENAVHPLVRDAQEAFYQRAIDESQPIAVFDIPLLYETGRETWMDRVIVVTTTAEIQRRRALSRPGMTVEKLEYILSRQLSDRLKREKADFTIDTSISIDDARRQLLDILEELGWKGSVSLDA